MTYEAADKETIRPASGRSIVNGACARGRQTLNGVCV